MTCRECGDKPQNPAKDFTKAVIEINNPEKLMLMRKVVIPASMGSEEEFPPVIGKYRNVLLQYEVNKHIYLYSSDGIPTALEMNIPQELLDRIDLLEDGLEAETKARADGDQELSDAIDKVADDLADEIDARELADENLEDAIDTKQDALTAGANISITDESGALVISAVDTIYDDTQIKSDLHDETLARQAADNYLQGEIDTVVAASDVKDIVGTYAELEAYDTSTLGDRDIIKVLQDETQQDQTTYYRWSTSTQTFSLIGAEGPYYTKAQTNALLNEKQDNLTAGSNITISSNTISATDTTYTAGYGLNLEGTEFSVDPDIVQDTLTAGDNITIEDESGSLVISATDTTYSAGSGLDLTGTTFSVDTNTIATRQYVDTSPAFKPFPASVNTTGTTQQFLNSVLALDAEVGTAYLGTVSLSDMPAGLMQEEVEVYVYSDYVVYAVMRSTDVAPYGWWCASYNYGGWRASDTNTTYSAGSGLNLVGTTFSVDTSTIATQADLDAKQNVLTAGDNITIQDESGDLVISATDTTYTAGDGIDITDGVISATSSGPTVVQTTGTSTTSVMSQNATTSMVFADPSTKAKIQIGASSGASGNSSVAIGNGASTNSAAGSSVAIGPSARARAVGSIAFGHASEATQVGEMNIGTSFTTSGYNNSNYRLITGLYDGQNAHDAATKGQLDSAVNTIDTALDAKQDELTPGTGISITEESGALVISATGAQIATINAQDWSDLWQ